MLPLSQHIDNNGRTATAVIPQSDTINTMHHTAAGVKTQNIPAGAKHVLFMATLGVDIFVSLSGTAAVPSGDITNGSGSEANPLVRRILPGQTAVSVAVNAATDVTLAYYSDIEYT